LAVLVWVSPAQSATCEKRFSPQDRDLPRDPKKSQVQNRTWTIMQGNQQEPSSLKKDDSTLNTWFVSSIKFSTFFLKFLNNDPMMVRE
jgi:hypothetical protein